MIFLKKLDCIIFFWLKNSENLIFYLFKPIAEFYFDSSCHKRGLLSIFFPSEIIVSFQEVREGFFCDGFGSELFIFEISDTNDLYWFLGNAVRITNAECLFSQIWICDDKVFFYDWTIVWTLNFIKNVIELIFIPLSCPSIKIWSVA